MDYLFMIVYKFRRKNYIGGGIDLVIGKAFKCYLDNRFFFQDKIS